MYNVGFSLFSKEFSFFLPPFLLDSHRVYASEQYFMLSHVKHILSLWNFQKEEENVPSSFVSGLHQ